MVHRPNPVTTISPRPPTFSTRQPVSQQQPQEELGLQDELAAEIYARLAVSYMGSLIAAPDVQHLKDLAAYARTAAAAFCEEEANNG